MWMNRKFVYQVGNNKKVNMGCLVHTYHFVGPQILSYNSRTWNLSEKTHKTQTKQMTQYNTNKQMSILQSPKSNTVHNIIKQYDTNYNRNNLSN